MYACQLSVRQSDIYMYSSVKMGYMYYVMCLSPFLIPFMTFLPAFSTEPVKHTLL